MISLQADHIICLALPDLLDNFFLAAHCVRRYDAVLYVQRTQKFWHCCDLVGLFIRHNLTQYQLVLRCKRTDYMIRFMAIRFTAANGLPVYSNYTALLAVASQPVIQAF